MIYNIENYLYSNINKGIYVKELRAFFCYDRTLLSKFAKAVNEVMKYQFHNIHKNRTEF